MGEAWGVGRPGCQLLEGAGCQLLEGLLEGLGFQGFRVLLQENNIGCQLPAAGGAQGRGPLGVASVGSRRSCPGWIAGV
jgi:hypothetical protein